MSEATVARDAMPIPRASLMRRLATEPAWYLPAVTLFTTAGLAADQYNDLAGQLVFSAIVWAVLFGVMVHLSPIERARTVGVILVATCGEIVGSVIWGAYDYRLGNLPLFVPPGHGLVYLAGLRASQTRWVRRHGRLFIVVAMGFLAGWAGIGLLGWPRYDVAGAIAAVILIVVVIRGRAPLVYCGVFLAVAYLEIFGTWVGTWVWDPYLPGTPIADGNPPSGIAAGYVLFDVAALRLAPYFLGLADGARRLRRWPGTSRGPADPGGGRPASLP